MSWKFNLGLEFRTIDHYPAEKTPSPRRAPFKRDCWSDTVALLAREVGMINGSGVYVLADCDATQLRADGQLRAEARLKSHAVVLVIGKSKVGPLKLPCDRFTHWQDNIRAIALSLEALRKVDRYGVTKVGEQYRGWSALPAGRAIAAAEWSSKHEAVRFLARAAGWIEPPAVPPNIEDLFRAAAKKTHPDQGGAAADFARVTRAREFIEGGSHGS